MSTMTATADLGSMSLGQVFRAYVAEAKFESFRMLRTPGMAIPFLLLPVPVYLLFGVVIAAPAFEKNPGVANYLFSGWCAFAVMGPALFGPGCALAVERDAGQFRLKRALPAPAGSWLVAKMLMAMVFAALSVSSVAVAALVVGKITMSGGQVLALTSTMVAGSVAFCAIGLCAGAHFSGSTAPAILNVIFLPMLWLSGLFFPLPGFLEKFVVIWPAFHLNQLAIAAAGLSEYRFIPPLMAAAVLTGLTVLFGGMAIHRLARKG
jgi:ABC-2 type transport system permease protein